MHAQLVPFGAANFLNRAAWPVAPAAVLVLLLPGWLAMSVTMLGKIVPASLRPAVALVLTLALTALLTALQLAASAPLARTEQALALICVALVVVRAVQRRRSGAPIGPLGWARSCFSDVRAGWRDTHLVARIVAVIAVLCGWILGTKMGGDAIYHTAQAVKLGALAHPNFDNTLQYADGSAHPGYFVPVVQQLIALVAHAAHTSAANTMWMLPAIIAPIAALTAAGTLRVYLGTRQAEAFGAAAWFGVLVLQCTPYSFGIRQAFYPRELVTDIVIPLVLVSVLIALYDAERATRWRALALLVVAQATVAIVHVSYVYFVGLAGLGYLVTWLIAGEKSRDIVRRHLLVGGSLLVVTVAAVGVLLPRLQTLETFASGKGASAADIALAQLDTPRGAVLGDLFRGTTHAYHLRADYLVWPGVLSIVAVVLVPLLLLGSTGAALVASQSNQLFPLLVQTAGAPQAKRLFLVVPTVAIIGTLLALVAVAIDRLLTHARASAATQPGRHVLIVAQPRSRRSQRGDLWLVAGLAAVALLALGAQRFPSLDTLHPRVIPEWPIRLLFIVMVVLALLAIVRKFVPALQTRNLPLVAGLAVSKTAVAATVVALAIGMSPAFVRMGPELSNHVARRAYDASYDAALGVGFKPQLLRAINALPIGSTIMTQPHAGYLVMALAPVYVVSSEPGHTANTPRNHLAQRYQVVEDFYRSNATDVARLKTLSDQHAVMLVATTKDASIVAFARRFPQVFTGIGNSRFTGWKIDHQHLLDARNHSASGVVS